MSRRQPHDGFQVKIGSNSSPMTIPHSGALVAWTISLGKPTATQIKFFNANEGGAAEAGVAVLRPQKKPNLTYKLIAQSPMVPLETCFGKTAEFPLETALQTKKGDIVALTVPTWAPALALGFGNTTSWRASRQKAQCTSTSAQTTTPLSAATSSTLPLPDRSPDLSATVISTVTSVASAGGRCPSAVRRACAKERSSAAVAPPVSRCSSVFGGGFFAFGGRGAAGGAGFAGAAAGARGIGARAFARAPARFAAAGAGRARRGRRRWRSGQGGLFGAGVVRGTMCGCSSAPVRRRCFRRSRQAQPGAAPTGSADGDDGHPGNGAAAGAEFLDHALAALAPEILRGAAAGTQRPCGAAGGAFVEVLLGHLIAPLAHAQVSPTTAGWSSTAPAAESCLTLPALAVPGLCR